jgi:hypothetical protein
VQEGSIARVASDRVALSAFGGHPYAGGFGSAACASGVAIELAAALVALARDEIERGAMRVWNRDSTAAEMSFPAAAIL